MRIENNPVTCPWTAEQLNDRTISFVPIRHGGAARVTGQILALPVAEGLYIQVAVTKPNAPQTLYWLNQEEANRIQRSATESGIDFVLV
jgi:hypothetical protein